MAAESSPVSTLTRNAEPLHMEEAVEDVMNAQSNVSIQWLRLAHVVSPADRMWLIGLPRRCNGGGVRMVC